MLSRVAADTAGRRWDLGSNAGHGKTREAPSPPFTRGAESRTPLFLLISNVRLHAEALRSILAARFPHNVDVSGSEASTPSRIAQAAPVLLLIDSSSVDGARLAYALAEGVITAPLVVYAVSNERPADVLAFATLHASGFVSSDASVEELHAVIEAVLDGEVRCPAWVTKLLVREYGAAVHVRAGVDRLQQLTPRQKEAVMLRAAGLTSKETAKRMGITPKTVKNEVHAGFQKLGVHSAQQAAKLLRAGVLVERTRGVVGADGTIGATSGP
jgi:DNA-binding NarL/FixJ family response regulator